jgi:hypothetical protein
LRAILKLKNPVTLVHLGGTGESYGPQRKNFVVYLEASSLAPPNHRHNIISAAWFITSFIVELIALAVFALAVAS